MKRMTGTQILAIQKRIDSDNGQWRNTWEDLAWHLHPAKVGFVSSREPGERKTEYLFDSTGVQALDDLAHYLSTALTPNAQTWAKLTMGDDSIRMREWLESVGQAMSAEWLAGNFYKMAGECYKDVGAFGTMCMEAHEKKDLKGNYDGVYFDNPHLRDVGGILNRYGQLEMTTRVYEKNAISWFQEFGTSAGEAVMANVEAKPDEKIKFLHVCYPRDADDIDEDALYLGDAPAMRLPYASVWVELSKAEIVRESGFYEPNRIIARWDSNTDTVNGHGPGLKALPDVRSLNEAKRLELLWVEKRLDPPMKTRENNVVGDLNIAAGSLTVCRDLEQLQELYKNPGDIRFEMMKTEELRNSIRGTFYSDLIRDEGLSARTGVSDYEVARRMERAQRILGEAVGGLRNEFLRWVVERTFSIMYRADQFEDLPEEASGEKFDVKYVSPLQTAQQAAGAESTALFIAEVSQLASVQAELGQEPNALDRIDFDAMTKHMSEARNVPAENLRSDDEIAVLRKARADARARANAMAEAAQAAAAAKDLGGAVGQDNAREMITNGQG